MSSAVPDELDELAAAAELGLRVLHRGELLAELVAQRRSICVARRARQDDHHRHDRLRRRAHRPRADLAGRRRRPPARRKRRPGRRRPAGGRGRRVRRKLRAPAPAGGRRHERRPRPPRPLRLARRRRARCSPTGSPQVPAGRRGRARRRRVPRRRARRSRGSASTRAPTGTSPASAAGRRGRGSGCRCRRAAGRRPPQGAGRPQRPQRRRRAGGAGRRRGERRPTRPPRWRSSPGVGRRFELRGVRRRRDDRRRLRAQPGQARGGHRRRPHAMPRPGWSCASSRTSTRAPRRRRTPSAARSPAPTRWWSPRSTPPASAPVAGVTAKLVVDAVSERRPGMPLAYMPALDDAAELPARADARRRPGADGGCGRRAPGRRRAAAMSGDAGLRRGGLPACRG